jgi:hypothetical protein
MAIELNPEQERIVGQALEAGLVPAVDDALEMGVAAVREILQTHDSHEAAKAAREWSRDLDSWVQSHSTGAPVLPDQAFDRDTIYRERGM